MTHHDRNKPSRPATIKDVAASLEISPSTVSRALRGHPDVDPETKKRVIELANELDYLPDSVAQSLRKRRTKAIGVLVPEIRNHFFSSVISGAENVAYNKGYTIMVSESDERYEREVINVRGFISNRVAGLLVCISQTTKASNHLGSLRSANIPFVFFDRVQDNMDISKVVVDDCDGAFRAVEHLILSGYKRIAHLAGPEHISVSRDRLRGYTLALQKHNLNFHQDLVVHGGFDEEDGTSGFQKLLKSGSLPDAIFAVNDLVAIGVFLEIKKRGLRIPDDLALVGFGDVPAASLIEPPLTTVGQHPYQMGQLAATLLLEKIEDTQGSVTTKQHVLKTELIIRGSTQTVKRPVDGT